MKLIYRLRNSEKFKKTLYYSVMFLSLLYIFCLPSFGESKSFLKYSIYASMGLLGVCAFAYCFLYVNVKLNRIVLFIPAFALFALIGTLASSPDWEKLRFWFSLVLLSVSFIVFIYAFKSIGNKNTIIGIVALAIFLFSLYFIFHYRKEILDFKNYTRDTFRLGSYFDNPNGVANYATIGVSCAIYLLMFWKNKLRYLFIIPILTITLMGFTTGSRTFLVFLLFFILVFLYFKLKKHKAIYFGALIGIILLGIVMINMPFLSTLKMRIVNAIETILGISAKPDTSTLERVIWMDYGIVLGSRNIFFGFGVKGFATCSGVGTYAHCNLSEVLCDFGIIGTLFFYLPLVIFLYKAITSKKIDKIIVVPFVLYYLFVTFTNVFYYRKIYYMILALMYYLIYADKNVARNIPIVSNIKKIVFTCDTMGPGGAEKVVSTLSNEMSNDMEVDIIGVGDRDGSKSFYNLKEKVRYISLSNNGKKIFPLKKVFVLRKKIKSLKPDVVISFLPEANIYTSFALLGSNIPFVVSERNNPYIDPKNKITRMLKLLAFYTADGCVFQTNQAQGFYPDNIKRKGDVIKNPLSLTYIPRETPKQRTNTVLAVGRLYKQKNYKCLLDAFKIFNEKNNNSYVLKIYGEGPKEDELKKYMSSINLDKYVSFMGNDPLWQQKEYDAAMYVLSSDYEGIPNTLIEALALGIPSISTDCPSGGPKELIKEGINGYLVPVNDPSAMAEKMSLIVEKSSQLTTNNKQLIDELSAKNITDNWLNYIKGLRKEVYE